MAVLLVIGISSTFAVASEAPEGALASAPPWATPAGLEAAIESAARLPDVSTDPAAAEGVPLGDLGRSEAADLLTGVFGEVLEQPAAVYDDLEVERFNSDYAAVVEDDDGSPGLLTSTLPLRDENAEGDKAPIDLDLALVEGSLQPKNPLVEVEIPIDLGEGISLPETGITVYPADAPDERAPSNLGGATAFYPNVAPDSDFAVLPTPTGMETSTVLRSPDAPLSQRFELSLPAGAQLESAQDGGAKVRKGERTLLQVRPPFAIDAEGESVPVDLKVSNSSIVLEATPGDEATWPILVDPIFESYSWLNNMTAAGLNSLNNDADWRHSSGNYERFSPAYLAIWDEAIHFGMNIRSTTGPIAPNTWATWYYYVPRFFSDPVRPTSFIKGMTLSQVYFRIDEKPVLHANPLMFVFLWSENKGEFVSLGSHSSAEGEYIGKTLPPIANPQEVTDAKSGGIALATSESMSYPRQLFVGQATVELSDKGVPEFGSLGSPSAWVHSEPTSPINYSASDTGLGVYQLQVKQPNATGGTSQVNTSANCVGTASQACPLTLKAADRPLNYDPSTMPQGESWVKVTATDPIAQKSIIGESRVKVDHTKPSLALSGTITEQGTLGTNLPEYKLRYDAADGDKAEATPIVPAIVNVGTGSGQMQKPTGVAVDPAGNIWVADRENNRVLKFNKAGTFQLQFGMAGSGNGQFNDPRGIAISPKTGNVWVSELGGNRVQQFKPNGEFVSKITAVGSGSFTDPYGIAVGPDGTVWVADVNGLNTVWMFNEQGTLLGYTHGTAGAPTSSTLELVDPTGVAVDVNGNAWVTDSNLNRVTQYSKEGGKWLSQFGAAGSNDGQLNYPTGIAVGPSGGIFVADSNNNRIQQFKTDGSFTRKFGTAGSGSGQLSEARGLAVDTDGTVLAAEIGNKRVARWPHGDFNPQSGVVKVEVKVDGQVVPAAGKTQTCVSTCPLSNEWTLKANDYSAGTHNLKVIATDGVGLSTTEERTIETHGDLKDPTIALSGTMTEQATLGTTRPSYTLSVNATDSGEANERKSGVVDVKVKIDGSQVNAKEAACPAGGCSLQTEWTLNNLSYSPGSHNVQVIATDAAGRTSSKPLSINIARDTTPPTVTASNAFDNAPEGWVEQKSYSVTATGQDAAGFGVTSMTLKIDGQVVRSKTQECPSGGCSGLMGLAQPLNMTAYEGGAHKAELRIEDGAGNAAVKPWTINVDPDGVISTEEAKNTLEAFDETGDLITLGEGSEEETFLSEGLEFELAGSEYVVPEAGAPTSLGLEPEEGLTLPVPIGEALEPSCPLLEQPQKEAETSEEPEPAEREGECTPEETDGEGIVSLEPVEIEPLNVGSQATTAALPADALAAVSANLSQNVDQVVRPLYNGAQTFMAIREGNAPEAYSWRVELDDDQELKQLDSRTAGVFYETGQRALFIEATEAHDAIGTELPTTISVEGENVVVLQVPHRDPSPAGGGYVYPVVGGAGWEGGFQTYQIEMPEVANYPEDDLEVKVVEDGNNARILIGTFGAPTAGISSNGDEKDYQFRFSDCQFNPVVTDFPEPYFPPSGKRQQLIQAMGGCAAMKEEFDNLDFRFGMAVYGWLTMIPGKEIWVDQSPKRIHCQSWGKKDKYGIERRAAVVDCFARPWRAKKAGITLRGHFRASSTATGNPGNASCFVPAMAVYPVKPYKELRETWGQNRGQGDYFEPCQWP